MIRWPSKELRSTLSRVSSVLALGASALLMFALTAWSLYLDRSASAGIAGAIALALLLLLKLPVLESFEVLTLKVKLRNQVAEGADLLRHIRTSSSVASKLMYIQLAFMNRIGDVSWSRKRALAQEIEAMLSGLEVSQSDISDSKRPLLNIITFDLVRVLDGSIETIMRRYAQQAQSALGQYSSANSPINAGDTTHAALMADTRKYAYAYQRFDDVLGDPDLAAPGDLTARWLSQLPLPAAEMAKIGRIRDEIVSLAEECWAAGTITPAAEEYLSKYGRRTDTRINELEAAIP
jgi:hypothetical protein